MEYKILYGLENNLPELNSLYKGIGIENIPKVFHLGTMLLWWKRFGNLDNNRLGYRKIPVFVVLDTPKVKLILPLMLVHRRRYKYLPVRHLEFFSQSMNSDKLDVFGINFTIEDVKNIIRNTMKQVKFDILNLDYLNTHSIISKAYINEIIPTSGKVLVPINESYEEIRKKVYSKNLRHILNKFLKRIQNDFVDVEMKVITDKDEILSYKEKIASVSISKLKDKGKHSIYSDLNLGNQYIENIVGHNRPFCSMIIRGDELLSYNIGYVENRIVYALDAAYNRDFANSQKIGMGILAYDNIVKTFSTIADRLDMGFGFDDYKFRFSKNIEIYYSLVFYKNNPKSKILGELKKSGMLNQSKLIEIVKNKYLLKEDLK